MEAHPPRLVEKIVGALIPRACREEVLGDWHERYRSPRQYLWDAAGTLPFIVASQVRRSFSIELLISEACALYIAFSAASLLRGPAYLYEHLWALPFIIGFVLFMLVLLEPYADPEDEPRTVRIVAFALTASYIARGAMELVYPDLLLPGWLMVTGNLISIPMLIIVRTWYRKIHHPPRAAAGTGAPFEELRRRSEEEHRKAWHVNFAWVMAAYLVLFFSWNPFTGAGPNRSILIFLITVAILVRFGQFKEGKAGRAYRLASSSVSAWRNPYRIKLLGKRDGLQLWAGSSLPWNLGGPAILLLLILAFPYVLLAFIWAVGQPLPADLGTARWWLSVAAVLALSIGWLHVRRVNDGAARTIQKEIDALDDTDKNK